MAPQFPDPPLSPTMGAWLARPWRQRAVAELERWRRLARLAGATGLCVIALALLAAWIVPPLLDWGRFRTAIASIAASELGRPVLIGGDVTLRLLPEAVLTAADVTLPASRSGQGADETEAISAQVGALRLQVAIWPLLAGRIVVRDLVLGAPVVTLPWPLPDGIAHPVRPQVPHAFAAHVENGVLHMGGAVVTGITAAIHGGPETAATPVLGRDAASVAAFGAEGFADFGGRTWRFTSALGAPDADGVSAVDLAVQGQGAAAATGGTMQGTLADGVVQGRLRAAGPDLSQVLPAAAAAWRLEAPFVATGEQIESQALRLTLGGLPAEGEFTLRLARPARLDARLRAASLDLDGWAASLAGHKLALPPASLPLRIDLAIGEAALLGGTLRDMTGALVSAGGPVSLEAASVTLPGGASLQVGAASLHSDESGISLAGPVRLDAPDLVATIGWLRPLAPGLLGDLALNTAPLRAAELRGNATIATSGLTVSDLSGRLDGVDVAGGFTAVPGVHPSLAANLTLSRLDLDGLFPAGLPRSAAGPAMLARRLAGFESDLHLNAAAARWAGQTVKGLVVVMKAGSGGLRLDQLAATVSGAHLRLSGAVGADGSLSDVRFSAHTDDLGPIGALVPGGARWAPGLWRGPATLDVTASGPPGALALQMRADAGDLVLEAELQADGLRQAGTATMTLRHPGAPRLLAALGLPGAQSWLDTGSLTLLAHLQAAPGHVQVQDFSLNAARLRLAGQLSADLTGSEPTITGRLQAEDLALPRLAEAMGGGATPVPWWWLSGWAGQIHLTAATVETGLVPIASSLSADLSTGGGVMAADLMTADLPGGRVSGQAAVDTGQIPPVLAVRAGSAAMKIGGALTGLPIDLEAGTAELSCDLLARGANWPALIASLSGTARADLTDVGLTGFDLAGLARASVLRAPRRRPAVQAALSGGGSAGLSGQANATIAAGRITLLPMRLGSGEGDVVAKGDVDLPSGLVDLAFDVRTSLPDPPAYTLRVTGPWRDAHAGLVSAATPASRPGQRGHGTARPVGR